MRAILQLKTITELKKMIRETNIRGYSKLNKKEIIDKMLTEDKRFMDYVLKSHKQQQKEVKKEVKPKGTHKMADGTVMSGSVHSKDSKPVKKEKMKLTITKADGSVKELKMKGKKPSAKELTDKAVEKAKAGGARVVKAKPKKEKKKKRKKGKALKATPEFEEIKKQKPQISNYTTNKTNEDEFSKLFASLK
tara:strand:+ start:290 stop:865 length:576 start_codon:yes stop_codon:yes gene_type:complete